MQCGDEMRATISDTSNAQLAVRRKYSSAKFGGVAKMDLMF
jgi:hypothetical protein